MKKLLSYSGRPVSWLCCAGWVQLARLNSAVGPAPHVLLVVHLPLVTSNKSLIPGGAQYLDCPKARSPVIDADVCSSARSAR